MMSIVGTQLALMHGLSLFVSVYKLIQAIHISAINMLERHQDLDSYEQTL